MPGGLVVCGLLTGVAVLACICLDETLGFNMLMCIFCIVAIFSLWSEDKVKKMENTENNKESQTEPEEKTDNDL